MKTSIHLNSDIQIPVHLYNEAAELFLNHLKKYYEAQLCSNDSLSLSSEKLQQSQNAQMAFQHDVREKEQAETEAKEVARLEMARVVRKAEEARKLVESQAKEARQAAKRKIKAEEQTRLQAARDRRAHV